MPSPIIHSAVAAASAQAAQPRGPRLRVFLILLFAANWADLDVVPEVLLGAPGRFHHGPTHSLVLAVVAALILAAIPWNDEALYGRRLRWLLLATLSHVGLDLLTADRPELAWLRDPGIPVFWPFSAWRHKHFLAVFHGSITPHSWRDSIDPAAVRELAIESVVAMAGIGLVRRNALS